MLLATSEGVATCAQASLALYPNVAREALGIPEGIKLLFGIALGGAELAVVVVTATLAAVGAAGIPSAGLVTMVLVVQAVNASLGNDPARSLPIEAIGIIIGVDRILDMVRTMVNVQGDMIGARLLTRLAPD